MKRSFLKLLMTFAFCLTLWPHATFSVITIGEVDSDIVRDVSPEMIDDVGNVALEETRKKMENIFISLDSELKLLKVRVKGSTDNEYVIYNLLENSVLSPRDVVRLFETGAVKIADGPLKNAIAELKIDDSYGVAFVSTDILQDAFRVQRVQQYLAYLNTITHLIWLSPNDGAGSQAGTDPLTTWGTYLVDMNSLSASVFGNYYIKERDASIATSAFVNPLGFSTSASYTTNERSLGWWGYLTDGYLGSGVSYKMNLDKGQFPGVPEGGYASFGASLAGWSDFVRAGVSFSTLITDGVGIGVGASISYSRNMSRVFGGFAAEDHRIKSIRGKPAVIINSSRGFGARGSAAVNMTVEDVPIAVAVRADANIKKSLSYKTYVDSDIAKHELEKKELPGLLSDLDIRSKEIDVPKLTHPDDMKEGDVINLKVATEISAAFVVGIEAYTSIAGARMGVSQTIKGVFNIDVSKFPHNKVQVSVAPEVVTESSIYVDLLNTLGGALGSGVAFAYKKKYLFDLDNEIGRDRYFEFINTGRLHSEIDRMIDLDPSDLTNFTTMVKKYNQREAINGTLHLEDEVMITLAGKLRVGLDIPLLDGIIKWVTPKKISNLWAGLSIEKLRGKARSFSYNDRVAVIREMEDSSVIKHELFSGTRTKRLSTALKVFHYNDKDIEGNKFGGLLISLQLEDSALTGIEKSLMVKDINKYFDLKIPEPKRLGDYRPIEVRLEKMIGYNELIRLSKLDSLDVSRTAQMVNGWTTNKIVKLMENVTGVSVSLPYSTLLLRVMDKAGVELDFIPLTDGLIYSFLREVKQSELDRIEQGKIVQRFVSNFGVRGFATIFHLLGGKPEDISLTINSNYMNVMDDFEFFKVLWSPVNFESSSFNLTDAKHLEQKVLELMYEDNGPQREDLTDEERVKTLIRRKITDSEREMVRENMGEEKERTLNMFLRSIGNERRDYGNKFLKELRTFIDSVNDKAERGIKRHVRLKNSMKTKELRRFYRGANRLKRKILYTIKAIDKEVFLEDETFSFFALMNKGKEFKNKILDRNIRQTKQQLSQPLSKALMDIYDLMDLEKQGFDYDERIKIYKRVNKQYLDMKRKGHVLQIKPLDIFEKEAYKLDYLKHPDIPRITFNTNSLLDYPQRWELLKYLKDSLSGNEKWSIKKRKVYSQSFLLKVEVEKEKEFYDENCKKRGFLDRLSRELCDSRLKTLEDLLKNIGNEINFDSVEEEDLKEFIDVVKRLQKTSSPIPLSVLFKTIDIGYSFDGFVDEFMHKKFKNHR